MKKLVTFLAMVFLVSTFCLVSCGNKFSADASSIRYGNDVKQKKRFDGNCRTFFK